MKKYYLIARNMWDQWTAYRLNFITWRIRMIARLLILYYTWDAIFSNSTNIFGYTRPAMLTYVLGSSLLDSIVFSSQSAGIGDDINQGNLSNYLLKPFNYFLYWFSKDIGDKAMNISFSIIELTAFYFIIHPPLFIQTHILTLLLFIISVIAAIFFNFYFNVIMGLLGFWMNETWAPRFLSYVLMNFMSGGLIPLNMLPKPIFNFLQFLPFAYSLYFPLKIYLGQLNLYEIIFGFAISFLWIGILYLLVKIMWSKGLKVYTAEGR